MPFRPRPAVPLCLPLSFALAISGYLVPITGCGPGAQFAPPPPPDVTVRQIVQQPVTENLEFTGATKAVESVEIRARVQGFLQAVHFEEGQEVTEGQLLFEIDPRPFQAALDEAKASLALAKAGLGQAQAARESALAENENAIGRLQRSEAAGAAVTSEELDLRRTAAASAKASVEAATATVASAAANIDAAQAAVDIAQLNLDFTKVTSPIDGRVGRRMIDVGNLVGATDATLLTDIIRYDPIYAYFTVSEAAYFRWMRAHPDERPLTQRDRAQRSAEPLEVRLALADETDYPHVGEIEFGGLQIDETTGTYLVRGVFPNKDRIIPPGAFVRLRIPLDPVDALLIDEVAIGRDQAGAYLRVVNSEDVVETRRINLGNKFGPLRVMTGDLLSPTDRVVVNGLQM
ncbi:MAG: efflux RND transporter periplasmic adaptor subunit, partial [Planctomycetales bacterium]|nr:efflux RND transporter periplasmic adaptor subunit [Planctomycetales bacterium]